MSERASRESGEARRARSRHPPSINICESVIRTGMHLNESLTEYLERVSRLVDPRPCDHIWDIDEKQVLRCVRCKQVHPEDTD